MGSAYCDECIAKRGGRIWSPGGTYCFVHKRELCDVNPRHCGICGKEMEPFDEKKIKKGYFGMKP